MEIDAITSLVSSMGFPIFVAIYLLVEGRRQNLQICKALDKLEVTIRILTERINKNGGN